MKKVKGIILMITLACLILTGCSKGKTKVDINTIIKSSETIASEKLGKDKSTDDFVLTIWNSNLNKNYIEKFFKAMYPKAKLNVVNIEWTDSEKISEALAVGNAPDVVIYSSDSFGNLNAIDGFENLLQPKYNFGALKSLFSQKELDQCMSFDSKKLIALPFTTGPMVTYYRKDILEQHGISTDPNELGDLMEKPEAWLKIAEELKKDNKWALQWKDEFTKMALKGYGYFDENMELKVDGENLKEAVKIASITHKSGLVGNYDIWTQDGKNAVRDGRIAMLYMNKWGEDYIKEIAPETTGKWRATRLPLGIYSNSSVNNISIVSSSKHKIQASKLVNKLIQEDRKYIASIIEEKSEFLGGQKSHKLYEDLVSKLPRRYPTMLDDKVDSMFIESANNNLNNFGNVEDAITSIKTKIYESLNRKQKVLAEYIRENRKP